MPASQAVPFRAPNSLAVMVQLPNRGAVRGLGVRWVTEQRTSSCQLPACLRACLRVCVCLIETLTAGGLRAGSSELPGQAFCRPALWFAMCFVWA